MHDRRKLTRWSTNKETKIKLAGAVAFIEAHLLDINFKGLQVSLRQRLLKDRALGMEVVLSEEFTLKVEVWIMWQRMVDGHNVYGLYFTKISDADKEKIYKFVFKHSPQEISKQWWKKGGEIMEDRRIFERFPAQLPMKFLDVASGNEGRAKICDISAKGVGLVTDRGLVARMPVEVWLEIPDKGEPLYTRGEVVWSEAYGARQYRIGVNLEKADLMGLSRALRVR